MEAEQEAVLTSIGEELDAACRSLARNGEDKLQVFSLILSYFVLIVKAAFSNFGHYRALKQTHRC